MAKMTFAIDDETARLLRVTAKRLHKPQSFVVREALAEYAARAGRVSESERRRMLDEMNGITKRPAARSETELGREIETIRQGRVLGGRKQRAG